MKLKPCTATTELLQQTLLSENSPILANQSLVPLGLWYLSLTKSTQGLLRLAAGLWMACWDTSDGKARASSDPCYTLWQGLGARRKQSAWCLYLKSDLTDPGRHAENPQISFKGPNSIIWESKSGLSIVAQGSPVLTVSEPSDTVRRHPNVFVFVLLCFLPLFPKPIIVLSKLNHFFYLLADVYPLVFAILICAGNAG